MTGKGTTSLEIHKMKCNGLISLRYQGVTLEGRTKQRLGRRIDLQKASTLTCPRNIIKGEQSWSEPRLQRINSQIPDDIISTKQLLLQKDLWQDLHRVHGHEHKVQGRLPLLQCITFHSLLIFQRSCSVEILSGKIPEEYDL